MSLFIDKKFVSLISSKLDRFSQRGDVWNFRCPFCGDSKKNKRKARGYLYQKKSNVLYACHNCGLSISLGNFIKHIDSNLFKQYQLERYQDEHISNVKRPDFTEAKQKPIFNKIKIDLPTIESLPNDHFAKQYVLKRKIPKHYHKELYFTDDFKAFVNKTFPEYDKQLIDNDVRLLIPFYDEKNILQGVQGRALLKSEVRYITIKVSNDSKKIFGLNNLNFTKTIYVLEGPIDSMFLDNSVATMDAALYSVIKTLGKKHDYVFVYDNEPRNKTIVKHMLKTIELGYKICIWPNTVIQKDINDMILGGLSSDRIQEIIDDNTFDDLKARLNYEVWRLA